MALLYAQPISFAPARTFGVNPPALLPSCVAAGDFNGDGKLDLIATNISSDNLAFLAGKGDGTFQEPVAVVLNSPATGPDDPPEVQSERCLVAADLNHDGKLDIAVVSGASEPSRPDCSRPGTGNTPLHSWRGASNGLELREAARQLSHLMYPRVDSALCLWSNDQSRVGGGSHQPSFRRQ